MYDDGLDPDAPFDDDVWELYHVADDLSEIARPRRRRSPNGSRRWSSCGGRRRARNDVLPLDNRILVRDPQPAPEPTARPDRYRYCPDGAPVPEIGRGQRAQPVARDHRSRSTCPSGVTPERRAARDRLRARRLVAARARRAAALRAQPVRQAARRDTSDAVIGAGRHTLGFAYERTTTTAARTTLLVDGEVVGGARSRSSRRPRSTTPAPGSPAATSSGRRWARATRRRSGSPGRSPRRSWR